MNYIWDTPLSATTGNILVYSGVIFQTMCQNDSAILEILIIPSLVPPIVKVGTGYSKTDLPSF